MASDTSPEFQPCLHLWLRDYRAATEQTRKRLAIQLGVTEGMIKQVERGKRGLGKQPLGRLVSLLGLSADQQAAFTTFARSCTPPCETCRTPSSTVEMYAGPTLRIASEALPTSNTAPFRPLSSEERALVPALEEYRVMHQLTWKQVAQEAGVVISTLNKLRHGEHVMRDATVWGITRRLGLLLSEDPKQPPASLAMLSTWPIIVNEPFDYWNPLWRDHASIDAGRKVTKVMRDGRYELSLWSYLTQGSTMGSDSSILGPSTFFMTVEVEQLEGSETGECGLLFGELNDTEFHVFYIRPARQHFSIASVKNDGVDLESDWHLFYPWQKHDTIRPGGTNQLGILRHNMSFWFYINGQVVADIHPPDFPRDARRVDLAIGMGEEGFTSAAYDNFILHSPPNAVNKKSHSHG